MKHEGLSCFFLFCGFSSGNALRWAQRADWGAHPPSPPSGLLLIPLGVSTSFDLPMMELCASMQLVTVSCLFLVYVRKACGCVNKPSPLGPKPDTAGGGNWQAERRKLKGALVRYSVSRRRWHPEGMTDEVPFLRNLPKKQSQLPAHCRQLA